MPLPAVRWLTSSVVAALACSASACTSSPGDVMATSACPDPLHRVLVATQSSAPGSKDRVGQATPSPPVDPREQHPLSATAVFHPDTRPGGARPGDALPVTVTVDDGTGGGTSDAERCQVVDVSLQLSGDALSTPYGTVHPGHLQLKTAQGRGSLRLVDQPTWIREADDGSGAQDHGSLTGWYFLLEDPAAGEYRTQQQIV